MPYLRTDSVGLTVGETFDLPHYPVFPAALRRPLRRSLQSSIRVL